MSSFWGIVFYIRNVILLGSTTKYNTTQMPKTSTASVAGPWTGAAFAGHVWVPHAGLDVADLGLESWFSV